MRGLLAVKSNMLASIITSALTETPIEVITERVGDIEDVAAKIKSNRADAVVMHDDQTRDSNDILRLLYLLPTTKVVIISRDGRTGVFQELRLHMLTIDEISTEVLKRVLLDDTERPQLK